MRTGRPGHTLQDGIKAVTPRQRGRSEATRFGVGEHTRTLLV